MGVIKFFTKKTCFILFCNRKENFPIEPNDMLAEDKKYFKFF